MHPQIQALVPEILAFIGARADAVVAHSAGFDISFLRAAGVKINTPVIDTYELATILLPGQFSYSLGELCRALQISLPNAHRAGHDAEATADLLLHLLARIETLPNATLEVLCAAGLESDWDPLLLFQDALSCRKQLDTMRDAATRLQPGTVRVPPPSPLAQPHRKSRMDFSLLPSMHVGRLPKRSTARKSRASSAVMARWTWRDRCWTR